MVKTARDAGAYTVLDSDAHEPEDLLTVELTHKIAKGAGLNDEDAHVLLQVNPQNLLKRLGFDTVALGKPGAATH